MKQTYIAPMSYPFNLRIENDMLVVSMPSSHDKYDEAPQLSNSQSWDSNNWTDVNDED